MQDVDTFITRQAGSRTSSQVRMDACERENALLRVENATLRVAYAKASEALLSFLSLVSST